MGCRHGLARGTFSQRPLVVVDRPPDPHRARRPDGLGRGAADGGRAAGGRAARPLDLPFRQPPGGLSRGCDGDLPRGLADDAPAGAARGAAPLCRLARHGGGDALFRRRGERRQALADARPAGLGAALGIPQARLRRARRLGLRRGHAPAGPAGHAARAAALADHDRAAGPAAGFRPDHAGQPGLVRPVLRRGPALVLGDRPRWGRRGRHPGGL
ncbi:hypothetical protein BTHI11S_03115 [Bosea thiooxidans]